MKPTIIGKNLHIGSVTVELPFEPDPEYLESTFLFSENRVFVCLYPGSTNFAQQMLRLPNRNRNVWCFGVNGQKLWEVEEQVQFCGDEKFRAFLNIRISDGKLIAYNEVGFTFEVDTETGNIKLFPPDQSRPW